MAYPAPAEIAQRVAEHRHRASLLGDRSCEPQAEAGVHGYPTWVFPDGSQASGRQSIETLAARSGCPLDDDEDEAAAAE
jgi:hypothetical protein